MCCTEEQCPLRYANVELPSNLCIATCSHFSYNIMTIELYYNTLPLHVGRRDGKNFPPSEHIIMSAVFLNPLLQMRWHVLKSAISLVLHSFGQYKPFASAGSFPHVITINNRIFVFQFVNNIIGVELKSDSAVRSWTRMTSSYWKLLEAIPGDLNINCGWCWNWYPQVNNNSIAFIFRWTVVRG